MVALSLLSIVRNDYRFRVNPVHTGSLNNGLESDDCGVQYEYCVDVFTCTRKKTDKTIYGFALPGC